jgi:hypothetical protein
VQKQIERLAERLERHEEVAEIHEALGPHLHAFDFSPEGERMRRYERDCQRAIDRIERELKNRPGRSAEQFGPAYSAYRALNPSTLKRTLAAQMAIESVAASREKEVASRRNEANGHDGAVATLVTDEATPGRNEANGHGGGVASSVTGEAVPRRNEANGHGGGIATIVPDEATPGRNEANGHGGGVATMVRDGVTPGRNEANGHGGETDLAVDTQAEVIERRQVGSATVTRFSLAAGVTGSRAASRRERRARRRETRERNR